MSLGRMVFFVVGLVVMITFLPATAWALNGSGAEGDPYRIENLDDFNEFCADSAFWAVGVYTELCCDLDLSVNGVYDNSPIAYSNDDSIFEGIPFKGFFEGNHYRINKLNIWARNQNCVGLFGYSSGIIRNLELINIDIYGHNQVGGLAGRNAGLIIECSTSGKISGHDTQKIGGLVGYNYLYGSIKQCYSTCEVNAPWYTLPNIGGLVGFNFSLSVIENCYASGPVYGDDYVGGLCGSNSGTIRNCYSTGMVSGKSELGGFCGCQKTENAIMENCFWDVQTSKMIDGFDESSLGTINNVLGLTTAEMHELDTFTNSGWDFRDDDGDEADWVLPINSYPHLEWEQALVYSGTTVEILGANEQKQIQLNISSLKEGLGWSLTGYEGCSWITDITPTEGVCDGIDNVTNIIVTLDSTGIATGIYNHELELVDGNGRVIYIPIQMTVFLLPGKGTDADPFRIETIDDFDEFCSETLYWMAGVYTTLYCDLDLSVKGTYTNSLIAEDEDEELIYHGIEYEGIFDGRYYAIKNLTINGSGRYNIALFGRIGSYAEIRNLELCNERVIGYRYVGGLVGYNRGKIINCSATGSITGEESCLGGLCGYNRGLIKNCFTDGEVSGIISDIGGMIGSNIGEVTNCYSRNSVNGPSAGGFCGGNRIGGIIRYCYSTGYVFGKSSINGFCSFLSGDHTAMELCFWDQETNAQIEGYDNYTSDPAVISDVYGRTIQELQTKDTYTDYGWDFTEDDGDDAVWFMENGEYPKLLWGRSLCYSGNTSIRMHKDDQRIIEIEVFSLDNEIEWEISGHENCPWIESVSTTSGVSTGPTDISTIQIAVRCNQETNKYNTYISLTGNNGDIYHIPINLHMILYGSGTQEDPYLIEDLDDFNAFCADSTYWVYGVYTELRCDLDLATNGVYDNSPIAGDTDADKSFDRIAFNGHFNGNYHGISNLNIEASNKYYVGLFGYVGESGFILNLTIDTNITGYQYVGGVVGYNNGGTIAYCSSNGNINSIIYYTGGLCGYNSSGGEIKYCSSSCNVTSQQCNVGGLVGYNNGSTIYQSYSLGDVNGYDYVGGFCGHNSSGLIQECFSTGLVTGSYGFCGVQYGSESQIINCIWDIEASGKTSGCYISSGYSDLKGKTTAEMQSLETYMELGWNFSWSPDSIDWIMSSNQYPMLVWENNLYYRGDTTITLNRNEQAEVVIEVANWAGDIQWSVSGIEETSWIAAVSPLSGHSSGPDNGIEVTISIDSRDITSGIHYATIDFTFESQVIMSVPIKLIVSLDGVGSNDSPFQIVTEEDFQEFCRDSAYWAEGVYTELHCDLDFAPNGTYDNSLIAFDPDTDSTFDGIAFNGCFNGNYHTISNLSIDAADRYYVGLFGYIGELGTVSNLKVNGDIIGYQYVGGVVGYNNGGTIEYCSTKGNANSNKHYTGGLCGYNSSGGEIKYCSSSCNVTSQQDNIGGLVGYNDKSTIDTCYSIGDVTGDYYVGGLCGTNDSGLIKECFSTGLVTGTIYVYGFCGRQVGSESQIDSCIWDKETSGKPTGCSFADGTRDLSSKTTAEMQSLETYLKLGWNFYWAPEAIDWIMVSNGYPKLVWENNLYYLGHTAITLNRNEQFEMIFEVANWVGDIQWIITGHEDVSWISAVSPLSGSGNGPDSLTEVHLSIDTQGVTYGRYEASIDFIFEDNIVMNVPIQLIVTLDGNGSEDNPYQIKTIDDFMAFCNDSLYWAEGVHTQLCCDLDLAELEPFTATPIEPDTSTSSGFQGIAYQGVFDGKYHVIKNMTVINDSNAYVGLFGCVRTPGRIMNLGLEGAYVSSKYYASGLAGYNDGGMIQNCFVRGKIVGPNTAAGLCLSCVNGGMIKSCYVDGIIQSDSLVGGLAGRLHNATIEDSYVLGKHIGESGGGICGQLESNSVMKRCYANVVLEDGVSMYGVCSGYIESLPVIEGCFWNTQASGLNEGYPSYFPVESIVNVLGKTNEELKSLETFTSSNWDFSDDDGDPAVWVLPENSTPRLAWESRLAYSGITSLRSGLDEQRDIHLSVFSMSGEKSWSITGYEDCSWISSLTPTNGVSSGPDNATDVEIVVDSTGLELGDYGCILTLTNSDGDSQLILFEYSVYSLNGAGTEADPFRIENYDDFNHFAADNRLWKPGIHVRLDCDLDLDPSLEERQVYTKAVIAPNNYNSWSNDPYIIYTGIFNGNGHSIDHLTIIPDESSQILGLFGVVGGKNTFIKNLTISNLNIISNYESSPVGGVCGINGLQGYNEYLIGGNILSCYVSGSIKGGYDTGLLVGRSFNGVISYSHVKGEVLVSGSHSKAGGICGNTDYDLIKNCSAEVIIDGKYGLGGLCGFASSAIENCYAKSYIFGEEYLGGLVGSNYESFISNCYVEGSVQGNRYIGGFDGWENGCSVSKCYSITQVIGNEQVGGFCAFKQNGILENSFWNIDTSGIGFSGDANYGAIGKTTIELQAMSTFIDSGWDFTTADGTPAVWYMEDNSYPKLYPSDQPYILELTGSNKVSSNEQGQLELQLYPIIGQNVNWTISGQENCSWITGILPNSGWMESSEDKATIVLSYDSTGLAAGKYYCELILSGDDGTSQVVQLELNVSIPGLGTSEQPYSINTIDDFYTYANDSSYWEAGVYTQLGDDLDLDPCLPGGQIFRRAIFSSDIHDFDSDFDSISFRGVLDGNNHTISNLVIDSSEDYVGLVAILDPVGSIQNLHLENVTIAGDHYVGAICGYNDGGVINNCTVNGCVEGNEFTAGICAYNEGQIIDCSNAASIYGYDNTAGVCVINNNLINGCNSSGTIDGHDTVAGLCCTNEGFITFSHSIGDVNGHHTVAGLCSGNYNYIATSYAAGMVTGSKLVGGLVGVNSGNITTCYSTAAVTADNFVGGFCALNNNEIKQAYSAGAVSYIEDLGVGGFCGRNKIGYIDDCFWDVETSSMGNVGEDHCGAIGMLTSDLKLMDTFYNAGWDIGDSVPENDIWGVQADSYPGIVRDYAIHYTGKQTIHLEEGVQGELELELFTIGQDSSWTISGYESTPWITTVSPDSGTGVEIGVNTAHVTLSIDSTYLNERSESVMLHIIDSNGIVRNMRIELNLLLPGSGTQEDPYRIYNVADFEYFCHDPAYWEYQTYTVLMNDIDLGNNNYIQSPIGQTRYSSGIDWEMIYLGNFDGNNHKIMNLQIKALSNDGVGLFGTIYETATIANLGLENVSINGNDYIGGLCGVNYGAISNCYVIGTVNGHYYTGGLCGQNYSTISNCYSSGIVSGTSVVGGFCGYNFDDGTISTCYTSSRNSGMQGLGGFTAYNEGIVEDCYFYAMNGPENQIGIELDSEEMLLADSYAGYDFEGNSGDGSEDIWAITTGCTPRLAWQEDDGPELNVINTSLEGRGINNDPYQINDINDFMEFSTNQDLVYGSYRMNCDIDLEGIDFTTSVINRTFGGNFDGNNHIVQNATITSTESYEYFGFFKVNSGTIENVGFRNIIIDAPSMNYVGGICGSNSGSIYCCYADADISGYRYNGGLCGYNYFGNIYDCYTTGHVSGLDIAGFCASNENGVIHNSYSTVTISNVYYSRNGFCYRNWDGEIINSFWDVELSEIGESGDDNYGATGKAALEMQMLQTFTDAGWDFVAEDLNGTYDHWRMGGLTGYPILSWQKDIPGDVTGDYGVEMDDFAVMSEAWGCYNDGLDLDDSGTVDLADLAILAENWLAGV